MQSLVILGAGAPHRGDLPAALREPRSGTSMLQSLLDASGCRQRETTFVAGYQVDAIRARYPDLPVVENPDWEHTGSGASLLAAPFSAEHPLLVCYSDILFRETVPTSPLPGTAPGCTATPGVVPSRGPDPVREGDGQWRPGGAPRR